MLVGADRILEVATAAVGPCTMVADRSWPLGESLVLELQTADGTRFVGKAHLQDEKHAESSSPTSIGFPPSPIERRGCSPLTTKREW
jgi:hypothetical protein